MTGMADIWRRLKQRKLVQWALAYVAAAFALLQGIDIVAQQFEWPEALQRGITLALALGFLVTLVLAWYHGERGEQGIRGSELMLLALLLGLGGGLLWRHARAPVQPPAATLTPTANAATALRPDTARASPIPKQSIAVLPLTYEGGDEGDRLFADGLSEDLITALSQYAGLKVIARNSAFQFRDSNEASAAIGRKLGVANLLDGSVRRIGDKVRISATLIDARDGSALWSERYDRPFANLFVLQDDITRAVVAVLRTKLTSVPGAVLQSERPPGGNPNAWEAYLRGNRFYEEGDDDIYPASIEAFQTAIRLDPHYAQAYAGMARAKIIYAAYGLDGQASRRVFAEARDALDKALELDPDLAFAHRTRAFLFSVSEFDWSVSDAELRRSIQLAPYDGAGKVYYGQLQMVLGHVERAVELTRAGLAIDPRNVRYRMHLLGDLISAGRLEEAEEQMHILVELAPGYQPAHARAHIAIQRGDARAALAAARSLHAKGDDFNFLEAMALQIGDDRQAADAALQSLLARGNERGASYDIAQAYALRHEPDQMFAWLERTWAARDPAINQLASDPLLAPYRGDPRFAALCRSLRVPVPAPSPGRAS